MKKMIMFLMSAALALPMATLIGCDREVSHTEKVDVKSDGTVKKEQTTVTEKPDGTIVKEQEKRVDK